MLSKRIRMGHFILSALVSALAIVCLALPVFASEAPLTAYIDSLVLNSNTGSVYLRTLGVPSPGLAGYKLSLKYDPAKIKIEGIERTEDFAAPTVQIDNELGQATVVAAQATGVNGEAKLAKINIKVQGNQSFTSQIQLYELELISASLKPLSVMKEAGTISFQLSGDGTTGSGKGSPSSSTAPGTSIPPVLTGVENQVKAFAGIDRFATSTLIAMEHFPSKALKNIVVVNGFAPADALTGAPLAYKKHAPILLGTNSFANAAALNSFLPQSLSTDGQITLLGGEGVLDSSYEKIRFSTTNPKRIAGSNRRSTAVAIAKELVGDTTGVPVVLVNENSFVDAVSIAPIAARNGWPILLTANHELSLETAEFLAKEQPNRIVVIGGDGVVSTQVYEQLKTITPTIQRIGGKDRFATNANVIDAFVQNPNKIAFANGDSDEVIDALAGASLGIPIVLVHNKNELSLEQKQILNRLGSLPLEIFGGPGVIEQNFNW